MRFIWRLWLSLITVVLWKSHPVQFLLLCGELCCGFYLSVSHQPLKMSVFDLRLSLCPEVMMLLACRRTAHKSDSASAMVKYSESFPLHWWKAI